MSVFMKTASPSELSPNQENLVSRTLRYKAMAGFVIVLLSAFWLISPSTASACSLELDHNYTVTPYLDDGLSRAERITCALGDLHYYEAPQGWREMRGADGRPHEAQDMAGVRTPSGELLVHILRYNRVALRWEGPVDEAFFSAAAADLRFSTQRPDGFFLNGVRLRDVVYSEAQGIIPLRIKNNSAEFCETQTGLDLIFRWNWACSVMPDKPKASQAGASKGRAVKVHVGGAADEDACSGHGQLNAQSTKGNVSVSVYAGPGAGYPLIDEVAINAAVHICALSPSHAWEGVVYNTAGRDCGVGSPHPKGAYSGTCKSGWIKSRWGSQSLQAEGT